MLKRFRSVLGAVFDSVSGIGTEDDPARRFQFDNRIQNFSDAEVASVYTKSGLMQKVVELIPQTAKKATYTATPELERILKEWNVLNLFCECTVTARLFEESYIVLFFEGDELDSLSPSEGKTLIGLYTVEKEQLRFKVNNYQQRYEYYLKLENATEIPINEDRILTFVGKYYPAKIRASNKGYHGSSIGGVMTQYGVMSHCFNIAASLLARITTFVFKMVGLKGYVEDGKEDIIYKRLQLHKKGIGSIGGLVLDANSEDASWLNISVAGVPEILEKHMRLFTAETELTHDILWNEGSNNTASQLESENFVERVNDFLSTYWQQNFNKLCRVLGYQDEIQLKYEKVREQSTNKENMSLPTETLQ